MRILVVEDDEEKRRQITEFLNLIVKNVELVEARSLQSGLRALGRPDLQLVVLDMTMPTYDITSEEDGGRPQAYAGRDLLRHMRRRGIGTPAVVLTQFDRFGEGPDLLTLEQLDSELKAEHGAAYCGAIHYSVTFEGWKTSLSEVVLRRLQGASK